MTELARSSRVHSDAIQVDGYDDSSLLETQLSRLGRFYIRKSNAKALRTLAYIQRPGHVLVEYEILNAAKKQGFTFNPDVDNKSAYDPQALVTAIARYGTSTNFTPDQVALTKAKAMTLKAFGNLEGDLEPLSLDPSIREWIWLDKSSGLPECVSKGEAFDNDLERAMKIASGSRLAEPCIAYHRVQHGGKDNKGNPMGPKTRLVWGYPQSQFLLEARFAPLLLERYKLRSNPMTLGLYKSQIGTRMLAIRNAGVFYSLDFSGFDSSIPPELVSFAFGVLKTHFRTFTEDEQKSWDKVVDYFIHTPIMMPNGIVWQKHRGVPSGSYFTSMVDSIVNYLAITYAWLVTHGQPLDPDHILVLGDDSIVGHSVNVPLSKLADVLTDLNLVMNVQKTRVGYSGRDWPHFLGHDWVWGMPDRDIEESWKQTSFPEKPSGIKDPHSRAMIRAFSRSSDAVSIWKMLVALSPVETNFFLKMYSAALWGLNGNGGYIEKSMRPGYSALLEEMGTLNALSVASLDGKLPLIGPYK
jgi:hypothetical protein